MGGLGWSSKYDNVITWELGGEVHGVRKGGPGVGVGVGGMPGGVCALTPRHKWKGSLFSARCASPEAGLCGAV